MLRPEFCISCGACVGDCPQAAIEWDGEQYHTNRERCDGCGECIGACYADAREMTGREMTVAELMAEILRDRAFFEESRGGVTFSGGEPLLQGDFLLEVLQACRAHELHITLDTCGHAPTFTLDRVREYVDLFLYDFKLLDEVRHHQVIGVSTSLILHHLRWLLTNGHRVIVRIPVIPGVNEDDATLRQMAEFLATLPPPERVDLLAYHHLGIDKYARLNRVSPMPATTPPSEERMAAIQQLFEGYGFQVNSGG
jgi:pyruvate formate lyase activating enzyme